MENSIEEDIKILEELQIANQNCIRNSKIKNTPFIAIWKKQNKALEHILSDYKRVLKENEKLNINLDDKKTEIQILTDDIKADEIEYKNEIETLKKENEEYSKQLDLDYVDKNYISKQEIEDKIKELKGKLEDISKRREKSKTKEEETVLWCLEIRTDERIKTLQELLEN